MGHLIIDIIRNSVLITGLVVVMMMMIESLNIESHGMIFKGLRKTRSGQVIIGALLGSIPGCMGGFASVSLYTHKMLSFGALVAMMIASSGDEAFIMLAMIPEKALMIFVILFIIAIAVGILTDRVHDRVMKKSGNRLDDSGNSCSDGYMIHHEGLKGDFDNKRTFGAKRMIMLVGLAIFIAALGTGILGHDHSHGDHIPDGHATTEHVHVHEHDHHHKELEKWTFHIDLLSEDWMNVLFAALSVIMLFVLIFGSDHFVEEHLWRHIVMKHLPKIFAWTLGVLLVIGIALQYLDFNNWISNNTALMILIATLIGIIPESGPHMIFLTLYATGLVPFPVLLASSISQDGHASLPLLAEDKKGFLKAKAINCIAALTAGYAAMIFI